MDYFTITEIFGESERILSYTFLENLNFVHV